MYCGHQSEIIECPLSELYEIFKDVSSYPEFIPHVEKVESLKRLDEGLMASVTLTYLKVLRVSYRCEIVFDDIGKQIVIKGADAAFKVLEAKWRFTAVSETKTKAEYSIQFLLPNAIKQFAATRVFDLEKSKIIFGLKKYLRTRREFTESLLFRK